MCQRKRSIAIFQVVIYSLILNNFARSESLNKNKFPKDFLFGAASSAYQIEGAWNKDGKTKSIWDQYTHENPNKIDDKSNGDIACDSYHRYKEDVAILKKLGVDFYRFSLSWPRILPTGFPNRINQAGVDYYNNLIDTLLANNIQPMVTIYHWDLPKSLQDLGGFANPLFVSWFEDYARLAYKTFGDRVKLWTTFNEPRLICNFGYGTASMAPGIASIGLGEYMCNHHLVLAHAQAYHLYNKQFKLTQKGSVGLTLDFQWSEPASNSSEDVEAAERKLQFECGIYAHPIFTKEGDYPEVVKEFVGKISKLEGFPYSRLLSFTKAEVEFIRGTFDFLGVNHYTTFYTSNSNSLSNLIRNDMEVTTWQDSSWPTGELNIMRMVPWGFRKMLKWIKDRYNNPVLYITENGYPDKNTLIQDNSKIDYIISYLSNLLDAIYKDGVNVKGYAVWSLLDYFEWTSGYTLGFGLYHVNFSDPNRTRTARASAKVYADIINMRRLPSDS